MEKPVGADERIKKILCYIDKNYSHITNIEQVATHFFLSKYYLCHLFKKHLGISMIVYLNAVKVRQACCLIEQTDRSMNQIAIDCGFNSESYFCKVFKNEKGISPSAYKKRCTERIK